MKLVRIAIFDSGLGSLSIIKPIQKYTKSEIIYFADRKNFPYGKKSYSQLRKIIIKSIQRLDETFDPDLIIIGSNTPTLLIENITSSKIIGVLPPIKEAAKITKTSNIAILATQSVVKSPKLSKFIAKNRLPKKIKVNKINISTLVELVESGKYLTEKSYCSKIIKKTLDKIFIKNKIDIATLSSTHLPFLKPSLELQYPQVTFLDPAEKLAKKITRISKNKKSNRNSIRIFTSQSPKMFQNQLKKIGVNHKVNFLGLS